MPEFTVNHQIDAPTETVWSVLDDFGDIQRWNPGVRTSALTSDGPVARGATRHCDLQPFGGVDERIESYEPGRRMTVDIHSADRLPIASAVADFTLEPVGSGTEVTIHYRYQLNRLGRAVKGTTDRQLRKGMAGLLDGLGAESERIARQRPPKG